MKMAQVNKILQDLAKKNKGRLTPQMVVTFAKPSSSPLHKYFTWEDNAAGILWREQQARQLILQVHYKVSEDSSVNAWVNFKHKKLGGQCYVRLERALSDTDLKKEMLKRSLQEVNYWKQQYATLFELNPIFAAIARINKKYRGAL